MAVSLKDIQVSSSNSGTSIDPNKKSSALGAILSYEFGSGKLKDSFKESFYGELALLLEAGMNVKAALDLLTEQQKKNQHKELLMEVVEKLTKGGRFSDVLKQQGKFTPYEYYSIRIGEETGNLITVLKGLSNFYSKKIQQRRTIIGALTYPLVIMFTAFAAVAFMLTYMVPMFQDVFTRVGGELPWLTQVIIQLADNFGSFLWALGVLTTVIGVINILYAKNQTYQRLRSRVTVAVPLIGPMILKTYTLRLTQSLSLLITSRVPISEALELSSRMVKFYPIKTSLVEVRKAIMQGASLHKGMSAHPIYEQRLVALIRVGEETNQLGMILTKLSGQMEEEVQHKAKVLGNTLEPLIIVFLGFLVAVILIAMYLPIFQISTAF